MGKSNRKSACQPASPCEGCAGPSLALLPLVLTIRDFVTLGTSRMLIFWLCNRTSMIHGRFMKSRGSPHPLHPPIYLMSWIFSGRFARPHQLDDERARSTAPTARRTPGSIAGAQRPERAAPKKSSGEQRGNSKQATPTPTFHTRIDHAARRNSGRGSTSPRDAIE